jgi:hypothetical protein
VRAVEKRREIWSAASPTSRMSATPWETCIWIKRMRRVVLTGWCGLCVCVEFASMCATFHFEANSLFFVRFDSGIHLLTVLAGLPRAVLLLLQSAVCTTAPQRLPRARCTHRRSRRPNTTGPA